MIGKKRFLILFFFNFANANQNWLTMQQLYQTVNHILQTKNLLSLENCFCHSSWIKNKHEIQHIINSSIGTKFVEKGPIGGTMVRRGFGAPQHYEICYLQNCVSKETATLIKQYSEDTFLPLPKECQEFNCSTNTLGHLFYTAKILEKIKPIKPQTLIEFGGGYGNLARIFKKTFPALTICIIDLPELLALQFFFLTSTLPEYKVHFHTEIPKEFETGSINLIPVFYASQIELNADIFISTFGLSETPLHVQKIISDKEFFHAKMCYLAGQINGWGPTFAFENHHFLFNEIQKKYKCVDCHPFHIGLESYELLATNI